MNYERLFQILAVIFGAAGGYFLYRGENDPMFVCGVLGAVAFFLSYRFQVKDRIAERAARESDDGS